MGKAIFIYFINLKRVTIEHISCVRHMDTKANALKRGGVPVFKEFTVKKKLDAYKCTYKQKQKINK